MTSGTEDSEIPLVERETSARISTRVEPSAQALRCGPCDGVSLSIRKGETFALVGESAAGSRRPDGC